LDESLMLTALSQWITRATSQVNPIARMIWLKVNAINPIDGKYLHPGNPRTTYFAPYHDGAGTAVGFPHLTVAVSTVTALARGRSSKGRLYPPTAGLDGLLDGTTGMVGAGTAMAMSTSMSQLITDLNGANAGSCVVYSQKGIHDDLGPLVQEITATKTGRVADVQSRRRRSLVEDYQQVPVS
jgi:hypothetical protein